MKSLFKRLSCLRTNHEEHKVLDTTKARLRVLKANEEMKQVIMDRNVSVGNMLVKEARTRIVLIVVNSVTLLVIALSQR